MTSSYFESRGRALDAPPDISQWNYDKEAGQGFVKSVNEQIDQSINQIERTSQMLAQQYNHMYEQMEKRGPAQLLGLVKQGVEVTQQFNAFQTFEKTYGTFKDDFDEARLKGVKFVDEDIQAYDDSKLSVTQTRQEQEALGTKLHESGDINSMSEVTGMFDAELGAAKNIKQALDYYTN